MRVSGDWDRRMYELFKEEINKIKGGDINRKGVKSGGMVLKRGGRKVGRR